jgi:Uma2 family endonuclease
MSLPALPRVTVTEYYRMAQTGELPAEARVELINGEIHPLPPIEPMQTGTLNRLIHMFGELRRGRWLVAPHIPARLGTYSEPQPDLMLLQPRPNDYASDHPNPKDVFLLIEIADSSLAHDREQKLPLYARFGIPEVWIVNLPKQSIEVYREPRPENYGFKSVLGIGDVASPEAFPDIGIDVAELFRK